MQSIDLLLEKIENKENELRQARESLDRYGREPRLLLTEFRPVYKVLKT